MHVVAQENLGIFNYCTTATPTPHMDFVIVIWTRVAHQQTGSHIGASTAKRPGAAVTARLSEHVQSHSALLIYKKKHLKLPEKVGQVHKRLSTCYIWFK